MEPIWPEDPYLNLAPTLGVQASAEADMALFGSLSNMEGNYFALNQFS